MNGLLAAVGDPSSSWLTEAGAVGVLAYFCWAFMTGRLRTEKEINRVIEERDRALDLVYKNADIAQGAVQALQLEKDKKGAG